LLTFCLVIINSLSWLPQC